MSLIDKLRRAREFQVEAGGHTFTCRRPTDAEAVSMTGMNSIDLVNRFVTGWDLAEIDLIPGGTPDKARFDTELWREWVADRPHLWPTLSDAVVSAYMRHREVMEAAEKN